MKKTAKAKPITDIDDYISHFTADMQAVLREASPDADETISYQIPAFRQHGILVFFAAWNKHIGLYPSISGDEAIEKAVARYAGPKGNFSALLIRHEK